MIRSQLINDRSLRSIDGEAREEIIDKSKKWVTTFEIDLTVWLKTRFVDASNARKTWTCNWWRFTQSLVSETQWERLVSWRRGRWLQGCVRPAKYWKHLTKNQENPNVSVSACTQEPFIFDFSQLFLFQKLQGWEQYLPTILVYQWIHLQRSQESPQTCGRASGSRSQVS